jgi:hypothetical protein
MALSIKVEAALLKVNARFSLDFPFAPVERLSLIAPVERLSLTSVHHVETILQDLLVAIFTSHNNGAATAITFCKGTRQYSNG